MYELRSPALAMAAASALMEQAALAHGPESFVEHEIPGLDHAWYGTLTYIAIRGNYVCSLTYCGPSDEAGFSYDEAVFPALAARLAE